MKPRNRLQSYLLRRARRVTARYMEQRASRIIDRWVASLALEVPRYVRGLSEGEIRERGRRYLSSLTAGMQAGTEERRAMTMSRFTEESRQASQEYLEKGLELEDILRASSLFRAATLTEVELMLRQRLWLALPQDVLRAEEQVNQALDAQMLLLSRAYLEARDEVIRKHQNALEQSNAQLLSVLREMQHRVKNNLQTVVDLMSLEMLNGDSEVLEASLESSIARIKAIAAVHDLIQPDHVERAEVVELARRVAASVCRNVRCAGIGVEIAVQGDEIEMGSREATALALVLNELLVNSVRHAFPDGVGGTIMVGFEDSGDSLIVCVADDGAGVPPEFDPDVSGKLGLRIVRSLVEQELGGCLEFTGDRGLRACLRIPK